MYDAVISLSGYPDRARSATTRREWPVPVAIQLELQELLARYSVARDDKDLDVLLGCFVPGAVFHRRGRSVEGLAEIRDFFMTSMRRYDLSTHTNHSQILDPGPDADSYRGLVTGHAELAWTAFSSLLRTATTISTAAARIGG